MNLFRLAVIGAIASLSAVTPPVSAAPQAHRDAIHMDAADLTTSYTPRDRAAELLADRRGHGAITFHTFLAPQTVSGQTVLSWLGKDAGGDVLVATTLAAQPLLVAVEFPSATAPAALSYWTLSSDAAGAAVTSSRHLTGADLPDGFATSSAARSPGCEAGGLVADAVAYYFCRNLVCALSAGRAVVAMCEGGVSGDPGGYYENPEHIHWFGNDTDPYGMQSKNATVYQDSGGYVSHVADFEVITPACAPTYSDCRLANGQVIRTWFRVRYFWPNGAVQQEIVNYTTAKSFARITQQYTYLEPGNHPFFVVVEAKVEGTLTKYYLGGVSRVLTVVA